MPRNTITLAEAAVVTVICFGFMIVVSVHAMLSGFPERPFTNANTIYVLFLEVVFGVAALLYLRTRNFDLPSLVPRPQLIGAAAGVGLYLIAWIACTVLTLPFVSAQGAQPIERMVSESTLSIPVIVAFALVNSAFEEVFLLGVLVRGLRAYGLSFAIGLPLLIRVAYHLYQGPIGAISILAFGIVVTMFYLRFGTLWPPVLAHVLADIIPFTAVA